ncbi:molecular chaperone [Pseudomonas aeruginosa]|uniref:fimbrial biogenesis chaperone n=1 Tax=Pseudomonas aeruginosa TaxID=287 RepID=UPI0021A2B67C|nr:molecular chaperone [Pseudomonas aeruginosa]MCT2410997.1 molecular chaperone [Pseudomonas aeruginosa]
MKHILSSRVLWAGVLLLSSGLASAGITLGGTRVVLQAPAKEASILVKNQAPQDVMIQSWMEAESGDNMQEVPFAITPPLSRLGANKQQTLRILYQGKGLQSDRESIFRLNVQEIPQKSKSDNSLQIAIRQRIKVFYRPADLPGTPEDAAKSLTWRLVREGGKSVLEVTNNSAFHVSFASVKLKSGSQSYSAAADMVAPKSSRRFDIKGLPAGTSIGGIKIEFQSVNDYGGLYSHATSLGG